MTKKYSLKDEYARKERSIGILHTFDIVVLTAFISLCRKMTFSLWEIIIISPPSGAIRFSSELRNMPRVSPVWYHLCTEHICFIW